MNKNDKILIPFASWFENSAD